MVVLGLMKIITFNIFVGFFLILMTYNSNVLISFTENMHVYIQNTHIYTYTHSYIHEWISHSLTYTRLDYILTFSPPPTQYTLIIGAFESNKKELYFPVWFSWSKNLIRKNT